MGRKLYCNGVIPLTPEKSDIPPVVCESTLPSSAVAVKSSSSTQALSPLRPDGASNFAIHAGQPSMVLNSEEAYDPSSEPVFDNIERE